MNNHKPQRRSLDESVPYGSQRLDALLGDDELNEICNALKLPNGKVEPRPIETKAIVNQQRIDRIRYTLNGICIAVIAIAIYMIFWS